MVESHGTISVLDPIDQEDDEMSVLAAQVPFHGNGGPDHSEQFIQDGLRDPVTIEIVG